MESEFTFATVFPHPMVERKEGAIYEDHEAYMLYMKLQDKCFFLRCRQSDKRWMEKQARKWHTKLACDFAASSLRHNFNTMDSVKERSIYFCQSK